MDILASLEIRRVSGQMALYTRCGFRMEWIDRGFFSLHYPEPILEAGLPCTDMVRMGMLL